MRQKKSFTICMALLPAAILLAAAAALCLGQFRIPLNQIIAEFSGAGGNPANVRTVLFNIRIRGIRMLKRTVRTLAGLPPAPENSARI